MAKSPYERAAVKAARRYKLPIQIFLSLIDHESGWQPAVVSPMGAVGLTQLMPTTAASLGVDPTNPIQNLDGGARYLRQQLDTFGTIKLALAAYNAGPGNVTSGDWQRIPETVRYVNSILGSQRTPVVTNSGGVVGDTKPPKSNRTVTMGDPSNPLVTVGGAVAGTYTAPAPTDSLFGADLVSKTAFENLGKIGQGWQPTRTLPDLVTASQVPPPATPTPIPVPAAFQAAAPQGSTAAPVKVTKRDRAAGTTTKKPGKVTMASGADRSGVSTSQAVKDFVAKIAGVYGSALTITTGTNHDQYVQGEPGVQSQHWTGDAADVAFGTGTGPDDIDPGLTELGQDALIAAGADPKWARQQTGGAYNIGPYNILFNTMVGGNHYDHLHVGV